MMGSFAWEVARASARAVSCHISEALRPDRRGLDHSMIRPDRMLRGALVCVGVLLSTTIVAGMATEANAQGRAKPAAKAAAPGGGHSVGSYGDWGVYVSRNAKGKVCYALSHPTVRLPKGLNRDPGYMFVSVRPADGVRNEIAWGFGFSARVGADAEVQIDGAAQPVVTRGENGWLKDASQEGQTVAAMARGAKLALKLQSQRGNSLTDEYSLRGFTQAMERVRKECP